MKKPMVWKEEDGTKYKISFSEELQLKNLNALKKQTTWEKRSFYAKVILIVVFIVLTISVLYMFYRLDAVNFFSNVMYR